ncbi:MAG: phosphoglycerate kinase [Candidatus Nomurabacteria bacterium]|jgi:phosphoglycerate kinase|nr:phosphoglycerate kinase [Candidatus Nomurabacteria bacterium]
MAVGQLTFPKKILAEVDVERKVVLLRTDYNVPIKAGKVTGDHRIYASLPTLRKLIERKAKVVVISHLGRPHGAIDPALSLKPVAKVLADYLGQPVSFVSDCVGDKVRLAVKKMSVGEVLLLENLRFHAGEEADDADFARQLVKSSGARVFVQDAYGTVHRKHASTAAITDFLPSVAGPLVVEEWLKIQNVVQNPNRPLVSVLGGAKIADKLPLLEKLIKLSDKVILGGAVANNFLMAEGFSVGASLWDTEVDELVNKIIVQVRAKFGSVWKQKFILPVDVAISKNGNPDGARHVVTRGDVKPNNAIFDIGTKSINRATEAVKSAGTVIWNGTLGLSDKLNYAYGSSRLALTLADNPQIYSLICGGDTVDMVRKWDVLNGGSFSYLSTGGGAALTQIAGQKLPGIESLLS